MSVICVQLDGDIFTSPVPGQHSGTLLFPARVFFQHVNHVLFKRSFLYVRSYTFELSSCPRGNFRVHPGEYRSKVTFEGGRSVLSFAIIVIYFVPICLFFFHTPCVLVCLFKRWPMRKHTSRFSFMSLFSSAPFSYRIVYLGISSIYNL